MKIKRLYSIEKNRSRAVHVIDENTQKRYVINVHYDKGGWNYYSGVFEKRGYYVSFEKLAEIGERKLEFYTIETYNSKKMFLEEAKRFSKSKLEKLAKDTYSDAIELLEKGVVE